MSVFVVNSPIFALDGPDSATISAIDHALTSWKVADAGRMLSGLVGKSRAYSDGGESPVAELLKSRLYFLQGDYQLALKSAELIQEKVKGGSVYVPDLDDWITQVKNTNQAVKGYKKFLSPKGHFEIALRPGKDEILLPIAFEVLERGYNLLTSRLGVYPTTPIRVEVYPTFDTLADVSTLTKEDIRNTGIIALCKYNRIMITSPSAQAYGYAWVDTLVHEFVHYLVYSKTTVSVPIWLHEGLAKHLERSWREDDPLAENSGMLPSASALLQRRLRENRLISFDAMHPSIAKLPNQDDASLAFAQVESLIDFVVRRGEKEGNVDPLRTTLELIDKGEDPQKALASSVKMSPKSLLYAWQEELKQRHFLPFPEKATYEDGLHAQSKGKVAPVDKIGNPVASDFAALAMMLQARGMQEGALVEFRKSVGLTGPIYPFVVTRMAKALNESKGAEREANVAEAVENLTALLKIYPTFAPAYLQLGRSQRILGKPHEALNSLKQALYHNPFDPGIYEELIPIYEKLGLEAQKMRAKTALKMLQ